MDYVGEWWLPDQPTTKVAGTLKHGQPPLTLALEGSFRTGDRVPGEETGYSLMYGMTIDGNPVTLFDVNVAGWRTGAGGLVRDRLVVDSALVGAHCASDSSFDEVIIELDTLQHWLGGPKPLDIRLGDPKSGEPPLTVRYLQPNNVDGELTGGSRYSFQFWPNWGTDEDDSIRIAPYVQLSISTYPSSKEALADEYVGPVQELITLATNYLTRLGQIWLRSPEIKWRPQDDREVKIDIQWLRDWRNVAQLRSFSPVRMLFTVLDVRDRLSEVIDKWLALRKRAKGAFDLYFGSIFSPAAHVDTQFYLAITAAEAYHREMLGNEVLPKADHARRIEAILASAPAEFGDWLKEKLAYSNEPSLRQRLRDLIQKAHIPMQALMERRPKYVPHAVFARNFYTHRESRKGKGFSGAKQYDLMVVTTLLLKACILLDLGFTESECWSIMMRNPEYELTRVRTEPAS